MAAGLDRVLLGLAIPALLWVGIVVLWRHEVRKAARTAEAMGLQPTPESTPWHPRYEGLVDGHALRARVAYRLKRRWLLLETDAPMPPGFTLVLGDDEAARAAGVPMRGLREVKTGWKHFDGWAWPRSSDAALAVAMLKRARLSLNAQPVGALWFHEGHAGLGLTTQWLRPAEGPHIAQRLLKRVADLHAAMAEPGGAPADGPEAYGPDEEQAAATQA